MNGQNWRLQRERVRMTQRQNDTMRHFGTEGHFGTATKCLIFFFFFSKFILSF